MSLLKELKACQEGQEWADNQESYQRAWETCERGDWMLWVAQKLNTDLKKLVGASTGCARLVEHLMKDERAINALNVGERFSLGKVTRNELDDAAHSAYAQHITYITYHDYLAYAAAIAAYAAVADIGTYAVVDYVADANKGTPRRSTMKQCADIVRAHISFSDLKLSVI